MILNVLFKVEEKNTIFTGIHYYSFNHEEIIYRIIVNR